MTDEEEAEFRRLTNQPGMRETPPTHPAVVAACLAIALVVGIGGVSAVIWLSWKIAVITFVVAFSLLLIGAALSLRSSR